jgi:L-alanine-DL-glutamate epimerase-like enolase superfamily enzyme
MDQHDYEGGFMRVDRVELFVTDLPARLRRRSAGSGSDTGEPGDVMGKPVLVKVFADGLVGYGQVRPTGRNHWLPDTSLSVVATLRDYYGPLLLGADITDLERLWTEFDRTLPGNGPARAAIDFALHDLIGKAYGVPVHALLGGAARPEIPLEWSVSLSESVEDMVHASVDVIERYGISNFSLKAGGPAGWRQDVRMLGAVREALGADVTIGLDANMAWTVGETIRAINAMADFDVSYVEQPIHKTDFVGLARVRSAINGVALIADEPIIALHDVLRIVRADAADAVCIKLAKIGGIRQARKMTTIAEAARIQVNVGGAAVMSQLEAAAIAHYYASVPAQHMLDGAEFVFALAGVLADPLVPETDFAIRADGHVAVPTSPGLGIRVDDNAVKELALVSEVVTG